MSRSRRVLLVVAVVLAVALVAAAAVGWRWLGGGRAQRSGEAAIAGLGADVEVRWDRWGVPYVEAASVEDLAAALGWLHANDRFTQMELGRRLAAGRLAEVAGPRALPLDRRHRTLRFGRTAERLWASAGAESRAWLTAYARGVNAWLAARGGDLPPDLVLLGGPRFRPEPWRPQDSLAFVMLMANDLSFWNDRPEEEHFLWLRELGVERTLDLAGGPRHVPAAIAALAAAAEEADTGVAAAAPADGPAGQDGSPGSNNWALGGGRTASGAPLLANDPHLPFRLPGTWYQALLRAPGYEVAGMTLPGVPGVVIGRNADLAWALTNVMLDDHDLYFEELETAPDGRRRVRRGDGWADVEVEREEIPVAGGGSETLELLATDHGPLLPADPDLGLPPRSLAWTLYGDAGGAGDPMSAFLALGRAATLAEVEAGLDGFFGPAQNLVVAHRDGGLLWTVLGRLPERRAGDGWLPAPGREAAYGWDGLRPRAANPAVRDPTDGLLVTANNHLVPDGYPLQISADYDSDHRARRIRAQLAAGSGWTPAAMARVQTDVVDLYAREVLAALLAGRGTGGGEGGPGSARRAAALLRDWDGRMSAAGAPGAALFALVERELRRRIFGDEAAAHGLEPFDDRERLLAVVQGRMAPAWFDDVSTPAVETPAETVGAALAAAWDEAAARWGDPAEWRYGELHTLRLDHPMGGVPLVGRLFRRGPLPMPGSATTVNAFGGKWREGTLAVTYGPSMRWTTDLAVPDATLAVLPAGQAGHPSDPHYDDQLPLYRAGELRPFPWSREAVAAAAVSRLVLRPAAAPE